MMKKIALFTILAIVMTTIMLLSGCVPKQPPQTDIPPSSPPPSACTETLNLDIKNIEAKLVTLETDVTTQRKTLLDQINAWKTEIKALKDSLPGLRAKLNAVAPAPADADRVTKNRVTLEKNRLKMDIKSTEYKIEFLGEEIGKAELNREELLNSLVELQENLASLQEGFLKCGDEKIAAAKQKIQELQEKLESLRSQTIE